jgi:hypothetical protein
VGFVGKFVSIFWTRMLLQDNIDLYLQLIDIAYSHTPMDEKAGRIFRFFMLFSKLMFNSSRSIWFGSAFVDTQRRRSSTIQHT